MCLKGLVLVLVFCGCGGAAVTHEPSKPLVQSKDTPLRQWKLSGEPSVVYVGDSLHHRETRIEVVPLAAMPGSGLSDDESKDWHLVRVNGQEGELGELNGKVFLAKWRTFFKGAAYMANIRGRPHNMLYARQRKEEVTWVYPATQGSPWPLVVEAEAPDVGEELLRGYYQQVDSGVQENMAPSTRAGRERVQNAALDTTRAELQDKCSINTLAIDWSTVEEGLMSKYSVAEDCAEGVRTAILFCESYPNVTNRLEAISKVRCDFSRHPTSETGELVVEGNELVYYVTPRQGVAVSTDLATLRTSFGELDQVLMGAKGTIIFRYGSQRNTVYYELDKRFYPIGSSGISYASIAVARGIRQGFVETRKGAWSLKCGIESLALTRVIGEKRAQLIAKATFEKEAKWKREPYFLARDTRGVYYYVDRYRNEYGGRHYRVFVGKRGMLKLTKLKGLVEDSEGTVFSTQKGELRLIVNPKASAIWIHGNKRSELTAVDRFRNRKLIYDELGVYLGENLGHICDE